MKVALIACSKSKSRVPAKARDLYQGNLFKKSLRLAELERFPWIFILSAKHGLLELNRVIPPYEETLLTKSQEEIRKWSLRVISELIRWDLIEADPHYFAGRAYYQFLPPGQTRFKGSSIGIIAQNLQLEIDNLSPKRGFKI